MQLLSEAWSWRWPGGLLGVGASRICCCHVIVAIMPPNTLPYEADLR